MSIDFRNINSLWASIAVETLARLGLQTAIVCPGSRSTPLTFAFAAHPEIEALSILDERSAAFFALGCAKRSHNPVALVCTSGTAGANFYPAIIEAYESGIALLVFTADRPPELRDCASGQTIDQQKLYGNFVKHYSELAVPVASMEMLAYLRQTLVSGWQQAIAPFPGPIHYNSPFRDPLTPIKNGTTDLLADAFHSSAFFQFVAPSIATTAIGQNNIEQNKQPHWDSWQQCKQGVIIAGPSNPADPLSYCQAVSELSQKLGWPVLAEGLSPLRNYHRLNEALISTYDAILRRSKRADQLIPKMVIQLGPLPISKVLRQWLTVHKPQRWIINSFKNLDPLHGPVQFVTATLESLLQSLSSETQRAKISDKNDYTQRWLTQEKTVRQALDTQLSTEPAMVESKLVWLLSQHLPENTPLFIANSMPVRDVEYFWAPNNRKVQPIFSRGANGIDGTLSTAMGAAHHNRPTVLLTGDLAFLHDTNGLLNVTQLDGHLTVIMINNQGGGIFEMLPISQFNQAPEDYFERYFVTPQQVDVSTLCKAYSVTYHKIETIQDFINCVSALPTKGVRVLEVNCSRKQSSQQRKTLLNTV